VSGSTAKIHVGVSGFSYPKWKGAFYSKETKSEEFLSAYSKRLDTVEINSSFYAPPRETTIRGWAEHTDERFRFSFKAPQLITHVMKLGEGSAEAAIRFSKSIGALGPRVGPILFQLAPYARADQKLLTQFLTKTSGIGRRVFEFRHESWLEDETFRLLEEHEVGFCIAETEDMKPVFRVTSDFAYFRLRKDAYDAGSVEKWGNEIRKVVKGLREGYVYLRHDETGENAVLAEKLSEQLS
jgi:uncharacterized protein YecE (DUF72 family)